MPWKFGVAAKRLDRENVTVLKEANKTGGSMCI